VLDEATQVELENMGLEVKLLQNAEVTGSSKCDTKTGGGEDYVWDPFAEILREEFLDCLDDETTFNVVANSGSPANVTGIMQRTSIVTFRKKEYELRKKLTNICMNTMKMKCPSDELYCTKECTADSIDTCATRTWWQGIKQRQVDKTVAHVVGACVQNHFAGRPHSCDCHEKSWKHNPVTFFHQGTDKERIKVCEKGPDKNKLCGGDIKCAQNEDAPVNCVDKWSSSVAISQNILHGCFFAKPTDVTELSFQYKKCNFRDTKGTIHTDGGSLTREQAQGILDVQVSKRAALVGIFLFKELGYISGFFTIVVILIILASLLLLFSPLVLVVWMTLKGTSPQGLGTRILVVNTIFTIYGLVFNNLYIIFTLVVNFSTCYRSFIMLGAVARWTVNKSLLDMDAKLTTLSSIIYTLVLLVLIEDKSPGESADSASGLGATLALQLVSLFFKIITEKVGLASIAEPLKDFNENRLSKFETALLWCKILEDFLQDDVQYNFVQLFNSKAPMMPDFDAPQYELRDNFGKDETGFLDAGHLDEMVIDYVGRDPKDRKNFYTAPLAKNLANKFGHDGQGSDYNPRYSTQETAQQSVKVEDNGLLVFMPGYTEKGIISKQANSASDPKFGKMKHEHAPILKQKSAVVGMEDELTAELFYGTEHPHNFGRKSDTLKSPIERTLQASGITAKSSKVNKTPTMRNKEINYSNPAALSTDPGSVTIGIGGGQFGFATAPSLVGFDVLGEEPSNLTVELGYPVETD